MKFFGFNISREPRRKSYPLTTLSTNLWSEGGPSGPVVTNAYQQVVWVYRAVNALAEQVANIPFRISRAGRSVNVQSGPAWEFYNRPHPNINRFQYWELRVIWLMLRGECFRVPTFDSSGRLVSVVIPDPAKFVHVVENNTLIGWRFLASGRDTPLASQVFLPEEVWHEKLPNPFDFWRGMSPLSVAAVAANTDYAASLHMKGVLENNGDAGLIIRTSEQLDPEQREQILAALRERKRRAGMADRPVLLWGGAEVINPRLSSADLEFLANRKFSRSEICSAFGVPEEIIGTTDNAKYDVMAGARLNFMHNRVVPLCRRLEAEEDVTLKALDKSCRGWFDAEDHPVLAENRRARLAAARSGFEMGIPFNELNRAFDLGFAPLPWGDVGYVPSNFAQAGGAKGKG